MGLPIPGASLALSIALAGVSGQPATPPPETTLLARSAQADQPDSPEGRVARFLAAETPDFMTGQALLQELGAAAATNSVSPDEGAHRALTRLQVLRKMLSAVPMDGGSRAPYRAWLEAHDTLLVYSEPAGQWLVRPEVLWRTHDEHRGRSAADEIAWLAVQNGLPGECEGYVPCHVHAMNVLDGEYLRRHPTGRHAAEAVTRVEAGLDQALRLLQDPDHLSFLNPATDCVDLQPPLNALERALAAAPAGRGSEALQAAERLQAVCPM